MSSNFDCMVIRNNGNKSAIAFLHGFTGSPDLTWEMFIKNILSDRTFNHWDIYSIGYPTSILKHWIPLWSNDPDLSLLAKELETQYSNRLEKYKAIALVAHSMGGLIIQRTCLNSPSIRENASHIINYGTPSGGLKKAKLGGLFKRQIKDMKVDSTFINTLRNEWNNYSAKINFLAVAGNLDNFVPPSSSLLPFPENQQAVVNGDHCSMIMPKNSSSSSILTLSKFIKGDDFLTPEMSAAIAIERNNFEQALEIYQNIFGRLDEDAFVSYALALEALGNSAKAIEILEDNLHKGTDTQGVLAGRLKRKWMNERIEYFAARSLELYTEAFEKAASKNDYPQCHYHAINVAFWMAVYRKDDNLLKTWAENAIKYANKTPNDKWAEATLAEAHMYIDYLEHGCLHVSPGRYNRIATSNIFTPRELTSIFSQVNFVTEKIFNDEKCYQDFIA